MTGATRWSRRSCGASASSTRAASSTTSMDRPERRDAAAGRETIETDVVVVGSGGAGLTAATVAARHGLDVLLVEKTGWVGGPTALSGGGGGGAGRSPAGR